MFVVRAHASNSSLSFISHHFVHFNYNAQKHRSTWLDFGNKQNRITWWILQYIGPLWLFHVYRLHPPQIVSIVKLPLLSTHVLNIFLMIHVLRRLVKTYKRIHRFMNVIEFFAMRQWDYQQDNLGNMWNRLSEKDKDIFFFDMRQLDWDLFLQHYFRGIRQYLLKDPLETIPQALVRWNRWVFLFIFFFKSLFSISLRGPYVLDSTCVTISTFFIYNIFVVAALLLLCENHIALVDFVKSL